MCTCPNLIPRFILSSFFATPMKIEHDSLKSEHCEKVRNWISSCEWVRNVVINSKSVSSILTIKNKYYVFFLPLLMGQNHFNC